MSLWTEKDIARATGGRATDVFAATGVSIDTRTLEPGDLFVALAGVRDGHEFVAQALAKGAAGVLAARAVDGPAVIVPDVQAALESLGVAARDRSAARRAAVTGSVGKTSVTQALRAALALTGPSHGSVKSYNNHIGVPLTLARMPRGTERAVFEIGMNRAGEIAPLARMVRPHAALVTTVGPVHTENFADGEEGVAREKAEVFSGLERAGLAVINADNRWAAVLRDAAAHAGARIATFGSEPEHDAHLISADGDAGGVTVRAVVRGHDLTLRLRQSGAHWGMNSLAVLLTAEALGVSYASTIEALEGFEPLAGRGETRTVRVPAGAFTLVDESYNANPISMAAAIRSLAARPAGGRRIVALTDMLELGPEAGRFHAAVADDVEAAGVDLVFAAGPLMASLFDALPPTRRGGYAPDAEALAPLLAAAAGPGDVIMVKGSNGSRAGALTEALVALGTTGAEA